MAEIMTLLSIFAIFISLLTYKEGFYIVYRVIGALSLFIFTYIAIYIFWKWVFK